MKNESVSCSIHIQAKVNGNNSKWRVAKTKKFILKDSGRTNHGVRDTLTIIFGYIRNSGD